MRPVLAVVALATACGRVGFTPQGDGDAGVDAINTGPPMRAVSTGGSHACAIDTTDRLWCWGSDAFGVLGDGSPGGIDPPHEVMPGTAWRQVLATPDSTAALRTDGTLWGWGGNNAGELGLGTNTPQPTPTQVGTALWKQISGAQARMCGLQQDDSLWCWGFNLGNSLGDGSGIERDAPVRITTESYLAVAAGVGHSCAVRGDHSLWCWGQWPLGDGGTASSPVPVQIGTATDWDSVAVGEGMSCGIEGMRLSCWGGNDDGEVGDGTGAIALSPVQLAGSWNQVSSGTLSSCAIEISDFLWCWGRAERGAIGTPTPDRVLAPLAVDNLAGSGWSAMSVAYDTACGIRGGVVRCTGWNPSGVLGDGGSARATPAKIDGGWAALGAGGNLGCGVKTDGTLWCWGAAGHGQLGVFTDDRGPVRISSAVDWTGPVGAGQGFVCARAAGQLACLGDNGYGELALPVSLPQQTPSIIPGYSVVAVGPSFVCGIRSDQRLACWGNDDPDGPGGVTSTPTLVGTGLWRSIAVGADQACGVQTDGTLWCFGYNGHFECGQANLATVLAPMQVGTDTTWATTWGGVYTNTSCATKTSGTLWCWGSDRQGTLGDGGGTDQAIPQQVTAASDWAQIVLGTQHACGLRAGTVWCWGNRAAAGAGLGTDVIVPTPVTSGATFVELATTGDTTCARTDTGDRWCWGDNHFGELGDDRAWSTAFAPVVFP